MKKKRIIITLVIAALLVTAMGAFGMPAAASAEAPSIDYATVVFKDAVDLRYFVKSGDEGSTTLLIWTSVPENMEYTKATADDVLTSYYDDSESVPGSTYKAFTYDKVAARQMGDTYYVRALYTDGSTELYSEVVKYSIQQYALNMLGLAGKPAYSGDDAAEVLALLEAMLEYGANAQKHFDHNADRLVNAKTVSVNVSGGVIAKDDSTHGIYYPDDAVELTAPATNADGMPFSHWEDQDGNEVTVPYTVSGEEGDVLTLTAKYVEYFTLTFVSNGVTVSTVEIKYGEAFTYPELDGGDEYELVGWENAKTGETVTAEVYEWTEDVKLVASWDNKWSEGF